MDRSTNQLALLRSTVEQFIQETGDEEATEAAKRMLQTLEGPLIEVDGDGTRTVTLSMEGAFRISAYKFQKPWLGYDDYFVKVSRIGQPWSQELHHPSRIDGYPDAVRLAIEAAFNDAREKGLYPR